jgi:hypothetical protein
MTLEENIEKLRDSLTVDSAMALRNETRLKEHQQWLEDNELAYAKHRIAIAEIRATLDRTAALQAANEEGLKELRETLRLFIDSMRKGGNGHNN